MLVNPSRMILSSKWSRDTPSHRFMSTVDRSDSEALIDEYVEELIMMDPIVSTDNSKVKLLKSFQLKKNRDKAGLILLENHRHIIDALQNGNQRFRINFFARGVSPRYALFFYLLRCRLLSCCVVCLTAS